LAELNAKAASTTAAKLLEWGQAGGLRHVNVKTLQVQKSAEERDGDGAEEDGEATAPRGATAQKQEDRQCGGRLVCSFSLRMPISGKKRRGGRTAAASQRQGVSASTKSLLIWLQPVVLAVVLPAARLCSGLCLYRRASRRRAVARSVAVLLRWLLHAAYAEGNRQQVARDPACRGGVLLRLPLARRGAGRAPRRAAQAYVA